MMSALIRTLTGKNKSGQVIYGLLDIMPIPPVHNLLRMAIKEKTPIKQVPAYVWQRLDKLRLTTSLLAIALAYAVVRGWISLDDAKALLEYLNLFV